jgi:hypothetical protein
MAKRYVPKLTGTPPLSSGAAWYSVTGPYLPGSVYVRLGLGPNGEYVCTSLVIDNGDLPLTTTDVRGIPLGKVIDDVVGYAGGGDEDIVWKLLDTADLSKGPVIVDATSAAYPTKKTRGGTGPQEPQLEEFAKLYKAALNSTELRRKPMESVAKALGIGVATAYRWRARCVELGLLDPPK